MAEAVTLELPEEVARQAQEVAQRTGRRFVASARAPEAVALAARRLAAQGRALAAAGAPPHDLEVHGLAPGRI